ncbi:OmpA family protein [uncultured Maribacter sp.]|uniref:OmpA family protein n=1 Tax=uncultured Maribacter sp. TaxID=431308 RepID=UPI00260DB86A|nr:OmpA family protein [uncultured Maribacter sp.]
MKTTKSLLKLILTILSICLFSINAQAQFLKKLGKRAEKAAERAVEKRIEKETEQKTDQALDSIFEPGTKKKKAPKKKKQTKTNQDASSENSSEISIQSSSSDSAIEVYRKFDFVPGDKVLLYDDLANDFPGDFPAKWNSNGSGEVVTMGENRDKWMELKSGRGTYYIPDTPDLPEEFTIEFDFLTTGLDNKTSSTTTFGIYLDDNNGFTTKKNTAIIEIPMCQFIDIGMVIESWSNGKRTMRNSLDMDIRKTIQKESHISMAINKQRVRLWINETKYVDIPRLLPNTNITSVKFSPFNFRDGVDKVFIRNLKIAEGGVDLRRKLIAEGKISTNGILFDSGSATIQPQSMGIIRQIYQVMAQENNLNLKIVGHTDSDGNAENNLKLSKKRAEAIKNALVNIYSITPNRLTTEGKGASEPVGDNATNPGKAQNRRVEFIKQ